MKTLLAVIAFAALTASAEEFPTIIIDRPAFDGLVIVDGAKPALCLSSPTQDAAPVVYNEPVVYNAPVQYNTPVVYNAPVVYNTRSSSPDDCGGVSITVRSGSNRNCGTITVVGRGSALVR